MLLKGLKIKGEFIKTIKTMITFEEAEIIAKNKISSEHSIVKKIKKPYGWYFFSQHNEFIRTRNIQYLEVGSGGFIVEKETGRVVEFGSAYSLEKNFEIYEKGFAYKKYDLTILKVNDLNSAIRNLKKLSMRFVIPEFENGVWWEIPQEYSEKQIKEILQNLPYTFTNQKFYFRHSEFEEMQKSKCLEFELEVIDK